MHVASTCISKCISFVKQITDHFEKYTLLSSNTHYIFRLDVATINSLWQSWVHPRFIYFEIVYKNIRSDTIWPVISAECQWRTLLGARGKTMRGCYGLLLPKPPPCFSNLPHNKERAQHWPNVVPTLNVGTTSSQCWASMIEMLSQHVGFTIGVTREGRMLLCLYNLWLESYSKLLLLVCKHVSVSVTRWYLFR